MNSCASRRVHPHRSVRARRVSGDAIAKVMSATWAGVSPSCQVPGGVPWPSSCSAPSRRPRSISSRNVATSGSAGAVARRTSIRGVILGRPPRSAARSEQSSRGGRARPPPPSPAAFCGRCLRIFVAGDEPDCAGSEERWLGAVGEIDRLDVNAGLGGDCLHGGSRVPVAGEQTRSGLLDASARVGVAMPLRPASGAPRLTGFGA